MLGNEIRKRMYVCPLIDVVNKYVESMGTEGMDNRTTTIDVLKDYVKKKFDENITETDCL